MIADLSSVEQRVSGSAVLADFETNVEEINFWKREREYGKKTWKVREVRWHVRGIEPVIIFVWREDRQAGKYIFIKNNNLNRGFIEIFSASIIDEISLIGVTPRTFALPIVVFSRRFLLSLLHTRHVYSWQFPAEKKVSDEERSKLFPPLLFDARMKKTAFPTASPFFSSSLRWERESEREWKLSIPVKSSRYCHKCATTNSVISADENAKRREKRHVWSSQARRTVNRGSDHH